MPRRHRKTRTGCTQCKRRRVKCDEGKPFCANCVRNNLSCSLEFLTPITFPCRSKAIVSQMPEILCTRFPKLDFIYELPWCSFDAQTSELLYHYNTVVSISLAGKRKPYLWHTLMPQIGLKYPFVLSGMLAISALHLSKLLPSRKQELQKAALAQENAALPLFRASFDKPDADSINSIFAFAGAVVYYIMALPDDAGPKADRCRIPSRHDEYPHWFQAIRGLMALLTNHWDQLSKGPFAPLLVHVPDPDYVLENVDDEHLAKLEGMLLSDASNANSLEAIQEARKVEICRKALSELRRVFGLTYFPNRPNDEAWFRVWIGNVSQDFVELIFERDPRALVIFAHYCVLIKRQDHIWYLNGLGPRLLENIRQALTDEWRPWIEWPIQLPVSSGMQ